MADERGKGAAQVLEQRKGPAARRRRGVVEQSRGPVPPSHRRWRGDGEAGSRGLQAAACPLLPVQRGGACHRDPTVLLRRRH